MSEKENEKQLRMDLLQKINDLEQMGVPPANAQAICNDAPIESVILEYERLKQCYEDQSSSHIRMLKGYDKNNRPFTAFCLLTNQQQKELSSDISCGIRFDLTKYKVFYQMEGHHISQQFIDDFKEFFINKGLSHDLMQNSNISKSHI
jgi:hypothetical protein